MKRNEGYLSQEDVRKIINSVDTLRDKLILKILANTGIRCFELTNLSINDIDFDKKLVTIRYGKYGKSRRVPIDDGVLNDIKIYINKRKDGYLFIRRSNNKEKITTKLVNDICKQAGIKADIKHPYSYAKYINPHLFRHSAIRFWLKNGLPYNFVSKIAGHTSTSFTMDTYGKPTDEDVEQQYSKVGGLY